MKKSVLIFGVCSLLFAFGAQAQKVIYVNAAASGVNDGNNWANAFTSLYQALKVAVAGDSIFVAKGTYQPSYMGEGKIYSFSMKEGVKIYGGFAGTETSLSQRNLKSGNTSYLKARGDNVIYNLNNGLTAAAVLDGFTITGGIYGPGMKGLSGGGIANVGVSPTIANCTISGNSATNGGGVYNQDASPTFINCKIIGNHAKALGGGVLDALESYPRFVNCIFAKNKAAHGGGMYMLGNNRKAVHGGGMYILNNSGAPTFINCDFFGNQHYGIYNDDTSSTPTIMNCIILDGVMDERQMQTNTITMDVHYSLIRNLPAKLSARNHNLESSLNPEFVDPGNNNFQLKAGSPVINMGNNAALSAEDTFDLAGNLRIYNKTNGGIVDLGAYEYQGNPAVITHPDANGMLYVDSSDVNNPYADGSSWTKALPYLSEAIAFADTNMAVKEIHVAQGTYFPTGNQSSTNRDSTFLLTRSELKIIGGFTTGGSEVGGTILSGDIGTKGNNADNSYHVMVIANISHSTDSIEVQGLTFTQGNANGSDSAVFNGQKVAQNDGGGLVVSGAGKILFDSCRFNGNNADHGGGLFNTRDSTVFTHCTFSGNYSGVNAESSGGGLENGEVSSTTFINCNIAGNQAPLGGGVMNEANSTSIFINCSITGNNSLIGGGVMNNYASTSSFFINCTISGNNAGQPMGYGAGGGIEGTGSSCTLTNCIVFGNSGGIDGSPTVNYSLAQGWTGGGIGNLPENTDPKFSNAPSYTTAPFTAGNYQLQPGSLVINSGSSTALPVSDTIDLAGNPRVFDKANGGIVDMGAYEYQGNPEPPVITVQPADTAVCDNASAAFNVAATGATPTYQWQSSSDGSTWSNVIDGTTDTLKISSVSLTDNGEQYRVILDNVWGADTSNAAALSAFASPVISVQPQSISANEGDAAAFSVTATGINLQYQWQSSANHGITWNEVPGATQSSFTVNNITTEDNSMQYRVVITGTCNSVLSNIATLKVDKNLVIESIGIQPPGLSRNPPVNIHGKGDASQNYTVFPNPVTNHTLTIKGKPGDPLNEINLVDMEGHQVLTTVTQQSSIMLPLPPSLADGIYILQIINNNQQAYTLKIVVQTTGSTGN